MPDDFAVFPRAAVRSAELVLEDAVDFRFEPAVLLFGDDDFAAFGRVDFADDRAGDFAFERVARNFFALVDARRDLPGKTTVSTAAPRAPMAAPAAAPVKISLATSITLSDTPADGALA